jgi:2'-5' RNA ligase
MARDFGAIMYQCKFPSWNKNLTQINEDDLYLEEGENIYGYEYEPHVTLVYGFHKDIDHKSLIEDMSNLSPVDIEMLKVSCFENEKFDVLKIDVNPKPLQKYRDYFLKKYDNTQKFDGYNPHITIAYLKKGTAKKYLNDKKIGVLKSSEVKYSSPIGHKIYLNL